MSRNALSLLIVFALLVVIPSSQAHAYLDPGSGSLIIQILVAGLLGLVVAVRVFWSSILSFFGLKGSDENNENEPTPPENDDE